MLALISSTEHHIKNDGTLLGFRVAMLSETTFEVSPQMFWVEYNGDKKEYQIYYNNVTNTIEEIPAPPPPPNANNQPVTQGTQTF